MHVLQFVMSLNFLFYTFDYRPKEMRGLAVPLPFGTVGSLQRQCFLDFFLQLLHHIFYPFAQAFDVRFRCNGDDSLHVFL